jgi:hypothetical protein
VPAPPAGLLLTGTRHRLNDMSSILWYKYAINLRRPFWPRVDGDRQRFRNFGVFHMAGGREDLPPAGNFVFIRVSYCDDEEE